MSTATILIVLALGVVLGAMLRGVLDPSADVPPAPYDVERRRLQARVEAEALERQRHATAARMAASRTAPNGARLRVVRDQQGGAT